MDSDAFPGDWVEYERSRNVRLLQLPRLQLENARLQLTRLRIQLTTDVVYQRRSRYGRGFAFSARLVMDALRRSGVAWVRASTSSLPFSALRRHQNSNAHCADQWIVDGASASWTASRARAAQSDDVRSAVRDDKKASRVSPSASGEDMTTFFVTAEKRWVTVWRENRGLCAAAVAVRRAECPQQCTGSCACGPYVMKMISLLQSGRVPARRSDSSDDSVRVRLDVFDVLAAP